MSQVSIPQCKYGNPSQHPVLGHLPRLSVIWSLLLFKRPTWTGDVLLSACTEFQPRGVRPPPQGAATGDEGARGERPQLPPQRSNRHGASLSTSRTGISRELCRPRRGIELSRGQDETSRTEPDAPLKPTQQDFAPRA